MIDLETLNDALPLARDLIKTFEGCKLQAYQDLRGIWTVGYGHTGMGVDSSTLLTQDQADTLLKSDLAALATHISPAITTALAPNELAALLSLGFNIGSGALASSTLLKLLNQGAPKLAVAGEFLRWNKAAGVVIPGLTRRRQAEHDLFLLTT